MSEAVPRPTRYRTEEDLCGYVPVHVVWEITLACNLKCIHCGSRAGKPRPEELSTQECLDVVDQLARLGTREVTLIGGEAYLRPDWIEIIRAIHGHGMYCAIQTGARHLTDARIRQAAAAGLQGIGVSIDGLSDLHDELRGVRGSYDMAVDALRRARAAGLRTSVNTQIGARTMTQLAELMDRIIETGATHWQIQLTVAMGNAVDHEDILLQPYQLLDLMPLLARLYYEGLDRGLLMVVGNNIGYFGPYEQIWRGQVTDGRHWTGCSAGQTTMGLEADGTVKGCPSLATTPYGGGNVRDLSIEDIWRSSEALHFGRLRSAESLWGFCRTCYYADVCRGGCTWTADSLLGRPGNNPYCHHRVLELEKRGLRERVAKIMDAPQTPFAIGEFELILEPIPGREADAEPFLGQDTAPAPRPVERLVHLGRRSRVPAGAERARHEGSIPPRLEICRACNHFAMPGATVCSFCGEDLAEAAAAYAMEAQRREELIAEVEKLIEEARRARAAGAAGERLSPVKADFEPSAAES